MPKKQKPAETPEHLKAVLEEVEIPSPPEPVEDDLPLEFTSPDSKGIAFAQYDPDNQTLIVSFAGSGGARYGYGNISLSTWREFYQADSKGGYFNKHIRPMAAGKLL